MKRALMVVAVGLVAVLAAQGLDAGGVLDREQRRLEKARETHAQELSRAAAQYLTRVERANTALQRVYEPVIKSATQRGDTEAAEQLTRELAELCSSAASPAAGAPADGPRPADGHRELIATIGSELVYGDGESASSHQLGECDYVVLYFTAHWCGPCRAFTPTLVKFYEENAAEGNFEVVMVSWDHNERSMFDYMTSFKMPYPAIPYQRVASTGLKERHRVSGIPSLVVLDREGQVVTGSYAGGRYVPPSMVLQNLAERFKN
jgi:nucleoredoxin